MPDQRDLPHPDTGGVRGVLVRAAGSVGADISLRDLCAIVDNVMAALRSLPVEERMAAMGLNAPVVFEDHGDA